MKNIKIQGYTCKAAISWVSEGHNKQTLICMTVYKDEELAKSIYGENGIRKITIDITESNRRGGE